MYEALLEEAHQKGLTVIEKYPFLSERIRGLCCDDTIALNAAIDTSAKCSLRFLSAPFSGSRTLAKTCGFTPKKIYFAFCAIINASRSKANPSIWQRENIFFAASFVNALQPH